jgi:MoxR-like ATPase
MMKVNVDYPSYKAEKNILELKKNSHEKLMPALSTDDLLSVQEAVEGIYVDEKIKDLIVQIVHATRPGSEYFKKEYNGVILAGASPRAVIWLYRISKYMAYMEGKDFVTPDHVLKIVPSVLGHRIMLSYEASIDNFKAADVALKIAKTFV